MTADVPAPAPPPPSSEASQLAELRRAELTATLRAHRLPRWNPLLAGVLAASYTWAFTLPEPGRTAVMMLTTLGSAAFGFAAERAKGVALKSGRAPRGLSAPLYWLLGCLAVGAACLFVFGPSLSTPAAVALAFALGIAAGWLFQHKMRAAVKRAEADWFGPPAEVNP